MYSLYRAWLMRDAVAAASLAAPPDLLISVGSTPAPPASQFLAHRHLVALHSGYLKSLLNEQQGSINVPSVTPDAFAPLLSFMYTGFLDLNQENIYSVLLATHLLHMPRALELCRAFLVQNQQEYRPFTLTNPGIIKPIASRKLPSSTPFWTPVTMPPLPLNTSPSGPFRSLRDEKTKSPVPSTSKERLSPQSSGSPCPSNASFTSDERTVHVAKSPIPKKRSAPRKPTNENLKAVLDVACCDGPVRFHRVLNESYGMSLDDLVEEPKQTDKEYLENYPKPEQKFSNFMHQQMLNSYKKSKTTKGVIQLRKIVEKEVEQQNENDSEREDEESASGETDKIYTCVYCNHTFKSQYCYQKHARRHINPVDTKEGGKNMVIVRKVVSTTRIEGKDNVRREVRLLDMNVQYYPCKTCGSKFPSYYFVHKHRKMCHLNEAAEENEEETPENCETVKT